MLCRRSASLTSTMRQSIDIASSSAHWLSRPERPWARRSPLGGAACVVNRLRISSGSAFLTVSCSRPAMMQSVSMRSSARMVAVSIGCTMYGSPLFRCCPACAEDAKIRAFSSWGASWPRYWQVDQNASTDASEPATPPKRVYCDALLAGGTFWMGGLVWVTRAWTAARGRGARSIESITYDAANGGEREHRDCPPFLVLPEGVAISSSPPDGAAVESENASPIEFSRPLLYTHELRHWLHFTLQDLVRTCGDVTSVFGKRYCRC